MDTGALRDELLRLELALARRDPTSIDGGLRSLIADDFLEFGRSGRIWTADTIMEVLESQTRARHARKEISEAGLLTFRNFWRTFVDGDPPASHSAAGMSHVRPIVSVASSRMDRRLPTRAVVSRASTAGQLHKLTRGLYTPETDPTAVVNAEWTTILAREFPGAVIVDASARALHPMGGRLFIDHPRRNAVVLPGLIIDPRDGPGPVDGDGKGPDGIFMSSVERGLLDNLAVANERLLAEADVQRWVEDILTTRGVAYVNEIRDRARDLAPKIRRHVAFERLNKVVRTALASGPTPGDAASSSSTAMRAGLAVDPRRIERFAALASFLTDQAPEIAPVSRQFAARRRLLPFYESYFSNYIEGTEFTLDEAAEIVFGGKIPAQRPEDAHDVLGTYSLATDPTYAAAIARDAREFIALTEARHAVLMAARPDAGPGQLRKINVRAGGTVFPRWELVEGTLFAGFDLGSRLTDPFGRSVYLHFLVSEVHPFADGNGRVSRLTMNAELESVGMTRIVVPTGYREDYLGTLRAASGDGQFAGMVSALRHVMRWTARMDFTSREMTEPLLKTTNALVDPVTAVREGIKLLLP